MRTTRIIVATALAAGAALLGAQGASAQSVGVSTARAATAAFHDISVARAAGWSFELHDLAGLACIDNTAGGMGIHYVNGALVGDGTIDARTPEAVIYAPAADGSMRLVAVEYVVIRADWDATHASPPALFGQTFELVPAGNRYGLPDFYELHAWLWKNNPAGMFEDWNPTVTCP
jgi:hypothetical protein